MTLSAPKIKISAGIAGLVVIAALAASAFRHAGAGGSSSRQLGTVRKHDLAQRITAAGTVLPKRRTVIMPPYTGYIKKIFVKVGDRVKPGDPVVSVTQSLYGGVEVYPLRAPFPGSVVQVLKAEGEYVEEKGDGNMLVRIDDVSELYVNADVPEIDMMKIKVGQECVIKASAILSRTYTGVIREISLAAKEKKDWRSSDKVDFPIRIEVTNKDDQLKPGMSTLIDIIPQKRTGVLALRHEFVQKSPDKSSDKYFVTMASGEKRDIEVGLQNEEMFEITKGLKEGERVRQVDFQNLSDEKSEEQDD